VLARLPHIEGDSHIIAVRHVREPHLNQPARERVTRWDVYIMNLVSPIDEPEQQRHYHANHEPCRNRDV
jgi:hypothetical protein